MNKSEQIIRAALPRVKLRSLGELAEWTGIPRPTVYAHIKKPGRLTKRELRLIVRTTKLKPEELYELVMSED